MKVEFIESTSPDLMVVNSARVSMDKQSTLDDDGSLRDKDKRLLKYLAEHNHFTPFTHPRFTMRLYSPLPKWIDFADPEHLAGAVWNGDYFRTSLWGWAKLILDECISKQDREAVGRTLTALAPESAKVLLGGSYQPEDLSMPESPYGNTNPYFLDATLRITASVFVARQDFKHIVGFTRNEVSRRYVDSIPEIFSPTYWRARPDAGIKQGSGGIHKDSAIIRDAYHKFIGECVSFYRYLIDRMVAPEMARMVLPFSMYTSYYTTGSLAAWARAYHLRVDHGAQSEIQDLYKMVSREITNNHHDAVMWKSLTEAVAWEM